MTNENKQWVELNLLRLRVALMEEGLSMLKRERALHLDRVVNHRLGADFGISPQITIFEAVDRALAAYDQSLNIMKGSND